MDMKSNTVDICSKILVNIKPSHPKLQNRTDIESKTLNPGTAKCYGFILSTFFYYKNLILERNLNLSQQFPNCSDNRDFLEVILFGCQNII